jgi:hypothetical protein
LYSEQDIMKVMKSRRMIWAGHGEMRNEYKILIGKHEGKSLLGKPRRRWENNIKTCFSEIEFRGVWIGLM